MSCGDWCSELFDGRISKMSSGYHHRFFVDTDLLSLELEMCGIVFVAKAGFYVMG